MTSSLIFPQVFANLEDTKFVSPAEDKKLVRTDPNVERVRRYQHHLMYTAYSDIYVELL